MNITVRFFGFFQLVLGTLNMELNFEPPLTIFSIWQYLEESYSQFVLKEMAAIASVSVNGQRISADKWAVTFLQDGDQVEFFSLMAGG